METRRAPTIVLLMLSLFETTSRGTDPLDRLKFKLAQPASILTTGQASSSLEIGGRSHHQKRKGSTAHGSLRWRRCREKPHQRIRSTEGVSQEGSREPACPHYTRLTW